VAGSTHDGTGTARDRRRAPCERRWTGGPSDLLRYGPRPYHQGRRGVRAGLGHPPVGLAPRECAGRV